MRVRIASKPNFPTGRGGMRAKEGGLQYVCGAAQLGWTETTAGTERTGPGAISGHVSVVGRDANDRV